MLNYGQNPFLFLYEDKAFVFNQSQQLDFICLNKYFSNYCGYGSILNVNSNISFPNLMTKIIPQVKQITLTSTGILVVMNNIMPKPYQQVICMYKLFMSNVGCFTSTDIIINKFVLKWDQITSFLTNNNIKNNNYFLQLQIKYRQRIQSCQYETQYSSSSQWISIPWIKLHNNSIFTMSNQFKDKLVFNLKTVKKKMFNDELQTDLTKFTQIDEIKSFHDINDLMTQINKFTQKCKTTMNEFDNSSNLEQIKHNCQISRKKFNCQYLNLTLINNLLNEQIDDLQTIYDEFVKNIQHHNAIINNISHTKNALIYACLNKMTSENYQNKFIEADSILQKFQQSNFMELLNKKVLQLQSEYKTWNVDDFCQWLIVKCQKQLNIIQIKKSLKKNYPLFKGIMIPHIDISKINFGNDEMQTQIKLFIDELCENPCKKCLKHEANVVCVPCGHVCWCANCCNSFKGLQCPECDLTIENFIKYYIS